MFEVQDNKVNVRIILSLYSIFYHHYFLRNPLHKTYHIFTVGGLLHGYHGNMLINSVTNISGTMSFGWCKKNFAHDIFKNLKILCGRPPKKLSAINLYGYAL